MVYLEPIEEAICQGDILQNVSTFLLEGFDHDKKPYGTVRNYQYSIVLTQACDLEQDYKARILQSVSEDKLLFGIMLVAAYEVELVRAGKHRSGSTHMDKKKWQILIQNNDPRYQYLGYIPQANIKLVVDFKDYFFVPCDYLYKMLASGETRRLASMNAPWRDHALQRFAWYLMRIGLSVQFHELEPSADIESL